MRAIHWFIRHRRGAGGWPLRQPLLIVRRVTPIIFILLTVSPGLPPGACAAAGLAVDESAAAPRHARPDSRIQRALDWFSPPPSTPIVVVDIRRLAGRIEREVHAACAFVIRGVSRIYVSSRCPQYQRAEHNPLEAVALAGLIAHEMAHLQGADEPTARRAEADFVEATASRLPGHYRARAAVYVADLRRRGGPVVSETKGGTTAFPVPFPDVRADTRVQLDPRE